MATARASEIVPAAIEVDAGVRDGALAPLPLPRSAPRVATSTVRPADRRGYWLRRLLLTADVLALCIAFGIQELAFGSVAAGDIVLLVLSLPLWVLAAHGHRLYHLDSHRADYRAADEIGPVLQLATLWSWGTLIVLSAIQPQDLAVSHVASYWVLTVLLLMALRSLARAVARRRPWYVQDALVMGPSDQVAAIVKKIERHPEWGITPIACPDRQRSSRFPGRNGATPRLPGDSELIALAQRLEVDRVMLAPAMSESQDRSELVCGLTQLGVHVDLVPSWSDVVGARLDLHEMEGMPLLTVPRARLGRGSLWLKRTLDVAGSAAGLLLLSPVIAACAIAIKLDSPGPVFFRQRRIGKNNRPFEVLKFRSMCADADARKDEVAALNLHGGGNDSGMFKIREDPRVTRVGRVLRRYSLDELPQLFNILRGEMSLVGPRPLIENEDRQVEGRFRQRLGLTPGLTGLWQAHGRSEIPFDEMVTLDYLYVTNWSLWGDVKLLMRTASAVLRGGGAY
jgi:exopolysaccharide biosynthesis polyprenyl glycosylphosphotransferase